MAEFEYFEPKDLAEACSLLDNYRGEAAILAGGTDLLVKIKEEILEPRYVAYSVQTFHPFQSISSTRSGPFLPPVPVHFFHLFRSKLST